MIQFSPELLATSDFLQTLLNAMPSPVFVVDEQLRVHQANDAARHQFDAPDAAFLKRGGHVMECLHASEASGGCGCSEHCGGCVIRNCAQAATEGHKVVRKQAIMQLHRGGEVRQVHLLVTASPLQHGDGNMAVIILEDISELIQLRGFLPICASCKKVRNDDAYWQEIEQYLHERLDVDFSHGICPDCRKQLYPTRTGK